MRSLDLLIRPGAMGRAVNFLLLVIFGLMLNGSALTSLMPGLISAVRHNSRLVLFCPSRLGTQPKCRRCEINQEDSRLICRQTTLPGISRCGALYDFEDCRAVEFRFFLAMVSYPHGSPRREYAGNLVRSHFSADG